MLYRNLCIGSFIFFPFQYMPYTDSQRKQSNIEIFLYICIRTDTLSESKTTIIYTITQTARSIQ